MTAYRPSRRMWCRRGRHWSRHQLTGRLWVCVPCAGRFSEGSRRGTAPEFDVYELAAGASVEGRAGR